MYRYIMYIFRVTIERNIMSDNTTYLIKNINRQDWMKFRAKCLTNGYGSAAEVLRDLIKKYSKGTIE